VNEQTAYMCDIQLRHQLYSSNFVTDLFKHSSFKNIIDFHFIQNINYSYYKYNCTVPNFRYCCTSNALFATGNKHTANFVIKFYGRT